MVEAVQRDVVKRFGGATLISIHRVGGPRYGDVEILTEDATEEDPKVFERARFGCLISRKAQCSATTMTTEMAGGTQTSVDHPASLNRGNDMATIADSLDYRLLEISRSPACTTQCRFSRRGKKYW